MLVESPDETTEVRPRSKAGSTAEVVVTTVPEMDRRFCYQIPAVVEN